MRTCAACATTLPPDALFCDRCGARQETDCGSCGAPLRPGSQFCLRCGAARGDSPVPASGPTPVGAGGVSARRVTTVLFGDLVGFTQLSESRDQEEVREILSSYFEQCRVIVDRYGGTIEKFIGDAVMGVWGVPVAHEDDAERAVRAGLELVDGVAELGEQVGVPDLAMRVGVVTGEVAVTVGARGQGMVAGDPVNTAARVQTAASPGTVWVDGTTKQLTQAAVSYVAAGSPVLKGKELPVELWRAVAVVGTVGGDQRGDGLEAPLVGRDRELRLVKDLFHDTEESRSPSLLLVSAGPGLGKTRLGWEFSKYTDGLSDQIRWLEGRSPAYGDTPFHALAEAFRGRLRALDGAAGEGPATMPELLDRFLAQWVPQESEVPWLRARMATLLGLPGASAYPREELFGAWLTVLERMSTGATATVLLIDDAQYADDGLLDFLEFALTTRKLPLLVVLLTRPELLSERPSLLTNPRVSTTHLRELSVAEMTKLVTSLVPTLPARTVDALIERSAGVPLYAVETVRSLIDQAVVVAQDSGELLLADPAFDLASLAAPVSLQALIAARLDVLPPGLRVVVDLASVLGTSFRPDLLGRLAGEGDVEPQLAELVGREVLRVDANPLSGDYGSYSFTQDVVRDVAYSMLARRDRQAIHLQIADLLEEGGQEADLPVTAHHLAAAVESLPSGDDAEDLRARAGAAFEAAGDWAMKVGSWSDAHSLFQRAVDLTEDPGRQAALLCRITEVHASDADQVRGLTTGQEAIRLARVAGDEVLEARATGLIGFILVLQGQSTQAARLIEAHWEKLRTSVDADDALRWLSRAKDALTSDAPDEQAEVVDVILGLAQRTRDPNDLARALNVLYKRYRALGLTDAAQLIGSAALQFVREHDLRQAEAMLLGNMSALEALISTPLSTDLTRQALTLARELHLHDLARLCVANLAICLFELGEWADRDALIASEHDELGPHMELTLDIESVFVSVARGVPAKEIEDEAIHETAQDLLLARLANAAIRVARGDRSGLADEVLGSLRDARAELGAAGVELIDGALTRPGEVLVALGDAEALETLLTEFSTIADSAAPPVVLGSRARFRAHLGRLRHGAHPAVADLLRVAVGHFEELGARLYLRRAQHDLADVLEQLGEHDEAAALHALVREFYQSVGAVRWVAELDATTREVAPEPAREVAPEPAREVEPGHAAGVLELD